MPRFITLAVPVWAAFACTTPVQAESPLRTLRACAAIEADAERLACYDNIADSLEAGEKSITARVKSVRQVGSDSLVIELDNGQVWRQPRIDVVLGLEPGDEVTISPRALGSYRLKTSTNRYTRVTRVR